MNKIVNSSSQMNIGEGFTTQHTFSSKPAGGYADYYQKMHTYAVILSSQAQKLDPAVTARTFQVIDAVDSESVFNYVDTASSRAGICNLSEKLKLGRVAIIGTGGTGSYVLDLVAKTPVKAVHIFDGDDYLSHNAFRSPGAPSIEELRDRPKKVDYFKDKYSAMHRNIVAHSIYVDSKNIDQLDGFDFVFLCIDGSEDKKSIVKGLERFGIPFVDVGMGIQLVDNTLSGLLRVTSSSPQKRDHVRTKNRISFAVNEEENEYESNIQVADLNALNAALAVIKWKKMCGFYLDLEAEHHSIYNINGNVIMNEDRL